MTRNSNVRIVEDMESFIDSLLAHTEEENCQHSISDFLQEYFDNKNKNKIGIGVGRPETSSNNQTAFEANDNSNPNLTEEEDD